MEGVELTAGTDKYLLFPITFQAYNAKGFGDFENGFKEQMLVIATPRLNRIGMIK